MESDAYMSFVPVEATEEIHHQSTTAMAGRRWVIGSLVFSGLSLAITPVVFGLLGVVTDAVAVWKGARLWGTAGVSASLGGVGQCLHGCWVGRVRKKEQTHIPLVYTALS